MFKKKQTTNEKRNPMKFIRKRQLLFTEQIMRRGGLEGIMTTGKINWKRDR